MLDIFYLQLFSIMVKYTVLEECLPCSSIQRRDGRQAGGLYRLLGKDLFAKGLQ